MTPLVSIVLPAYNAADTIGEAIRGVLAQTFSNWELLVIDDGSDDATSAAAREGSGADPRIRVISMPHGGIVAALHAGTSEARGELIARMDADDLSHPERLAEQVALLSADRSVGVVSCLVEYGGDRHANAGYALHVDWINSLLTPDDIALNRFIESPFAHPSVMFRREVLDRCGGYREGAFPEDYELWLRWLDAGVRMAKVPKFLLRWNDSPARLSRSDPRYSPDRFFEVKAPWIARELRRHAQPPDTEGGATAVAAHAKRSHRAVWIWGAGRPTRKRAAHLATHGVKIAGFIDIDPKKTGRLVGGLPVVPPSELPSPADGFILGYVSSRGARELIRATLQSRGHTEGCDYLMCA